VTKKIDLPIVYYFMADKKNGLDATDYKLSDREIRYVIDELNEDEIGIHPTFDSSHRKDIADEIEKINSELNIKVKHARQHFLKYDITDTWRSYEKKGIRYSSNIQFTEGMGFAAGTCRPFSLFDILERKVLRVVEIPLLVMIKKDYAINYENQLIKIAEIIEKAKKYKGEFMLLVHNSNLETNRERLLLKKIIELV
jgi:hypothetical protein